MEHLGRRYRTAALTMAIALVVAGCGSATTPNGSTSAASASASVASEAPASAAVAPSLTPTASGLVEIPAATDPSAGGRAELDLVRQLREEAGMTARLGVGGAEAFAALDAIEADFGQKVLQDAATLFEGKTASTRLPPDVPAPVAGDSLFGQLAATREFGAAPQLGPDAIEISLFADTGFTANALMGLFAGIVRQAATAGQGTIPREEHFTDDSGGLHQEVDLKTTLSVNTGGGHASGDIRMSATDRISKSDGTFVALYTSTADGHFDVNACPDTGGIGEGTYSFATKHEMNDVSGAANAQSGAGRSVEGPFKLVNGDDARLLRIEASLQIDADARGPGPPGGPGPSNWTSSQQLGVSMPARGGTTTSGAAPTVSGSGSEAASGAMFLSSAMAQLFLATIGAEAERFWRSGECIELKPNPDSKKVEPSEKVELIVDSKAKFGDHADVKGPIVAKFSGKKSLDPHDRPQDAPAHFAFEAGTEEGDVGTIDLEQTSRRGIGKRQVKYTVGGGLKLSLSSKSTADLAKNLRVTYQGTIKDLRLARQDDAYEGRGSIKATITLKLSASGAECTGSKSKTYDVGVKGVPVPDHEDQLDLSFDYSAGSIDRFTIECKTKEGSGSMPAPWSGLISLLPLPGDAKRVTIDSTTRIVVPGSNPITIDLTVTREKK